MNSKTTIEKLWNKKRNGEKITALTAYDFSMAQVIDESGVDLILVGDSLGMVALGFESTLKVTMEDMLHHTKAVSRGVKNSLLVADMPFLSYGVSQERTLENAKKFIQEGGAQAVKVEGTSETILDEIRRMVELGIPVLGHIGMLPTHIYAESKYHVYGKDEKSKNDLLHDALALQQAGVLGIVLECISSDTAKEITTQIKAPTIGIGAGPHCDGQILVSYDMLGFYEKIQPKFVKRYAYLAKAMKDAFGNYVSDVRNKKFPSKEQSY